MAAIMLTIKIIELLVDKLLIIDMQRIGGQLEERVRYLRIRLLFYLFRRMRPHTWSNHRQMRLYRTPNGTKKKSSNCVGSLDVRATFLYLRGKQNFRDDVCGFGAYRPLNQPILIIAAILFSLCIYLK